MFFLIRDRKLFGFMFEPIAILPNFRMFKNIYLITLLVTFSDELCKCKYFGDIQSCLHVGYPLKTIRKC